MPKAKDNDEPRRLKVDEYIERAMQAEDNEDAEQELLRGLEVAEETREDSEIVEILTVYTDLLVGQARNEEAREHLERMIGLLEKAGKKGNVDLASAYGTLADIELQEDNPESAIPLLKGAIKQLKNVKDEDPSFNASLWERLADAHESMEDPRFLQELAQAFDYAREGSIPDLAARLGLRLSESLESADELEAAADVLTMALDEYIVVLSEVPDPEAIHDPACMALEMIKKEFRDDHCEPYLLLEIRLELARLEILLERGSGDIVPGMAEMSTFMGRLTGEDSLELTLQYQDVGASLQALAEVSKRSHDFAKALEYYERGFTILKKHMNENDDEARQMAKELEKVLAMLKSRL